MERSEFLVGRIQSILTESRNGELARNPEREKETSLNNEMGFNSNRIATQVHERPLLSPVEIKTGLDYLASLSTVKSEKIQTFHRPFEPNQHLNPENVRNPMEISQENQRTPFGILETIRNQEMTLSQRQGSVEFPENYLEVNERTALCLEKGREREEKRQTGLQYYKPKPEYMGNKSEEARSELFQWKTDAQAGVSGANLHQGPSGTHHLLDSLQYSDSSAGNSVGFSFNIKDTQNVASQSESGLSGAYHRVRFRSPEPELLSGMTASCSKQLLRPSKFSSVEQFKRELDCRFEKAISACLKIEAIKTSKESPKREKEERNQETKRRKEQKESLETDRLIEKAEKLLATYKHSKGTERIE